MFRLETPAIEDSRQGSFIGGLRTRVILESIRDIARSKNGRIATNERGFPPICFNRWHFSEAGVFQEMAILRQTNVVFRQFVSIAGFFLKREFDTAHSRMAEALDLMPRYWWVVFQI